MKVITITEENIKAVYGRVRKFFYNKNKTGFKSWHNFDCGFKKHIPALRSHTTGGQIINYYPSPNDIRIVGNKHIVFNLTSSHVMALSLGDKIAFLGNQIICRSKSILIDYRYCYKVFQAYPMSNDNQNYIRYITRLESEEFENHGFD